MVPASRYRVVVSALVAAVALVAVVFAFSPFNPVKMLPSADSGQGRVAAIPVKPSYNESAYASDQAVVTEEDAAALGQVVANGSAVNDDFIAAVAAADAPYTSQVGVVSLNEIGLPSGCEIASLAVVLQSMGFDADPLALADDFLVKDGSFATGYAGSPYGAGGGFPPGIVNAANSYLAANGSDVRAYDLTGTSFEGLKGIMAHGYPVLVWSTMFMENPLFSGAYDGEAEWYDNEHCVVAYEAVEDGVLVSDPLEGYVVRNEAEFERIYTECGSMALVVM